MDAASNSETSGNFYQMTLRYENLKSDEKEKYIYIYIVLRS